MTRQIELSPSSGPDQPTFEVCIDEAGDDGMDCVSGEWMIVSAVLSLRVHYGNYVSLVRDIKSEIGWKEKKPLHFRDLPEKGKHLVTQGIADNYSRLRLISVFLHKPSLAADESAWYEQKHRVYFYLVRVLMERISWACRDSISINNRSIGNGTARIVFSAREDLSYEQMAVYFSHLQEMDTRIEWSVIRPDQFKVLKNGKHPGLQLADAVASSMYCCDHHCVRKRTSDWVKTLKPAVYHYKGKHISYGIKIFPPEAEKQMAQGILAPWAMEFF